MKFNYFSSTFIGPNICSSISFSAPSKKPTEYEQLATRRLIYRVFSQDSLNSGRWFPLRKISPTKCTLLQNLTDFLMFFWASFQYSSFNIFFVHVFVLLFMIWILKFLKLSLVEQYFKKYSLWNKFQIVLMILVCSIQNLICTCLY